VSSAVVIRKRHETADAFAIAHLILESNAYYSSLAPGLFTPIQEDGLEEWIASDSRWFARETSLALIAEIAGEVAGYLEASVEEPDPDAQFSGNRDLRERRLYINAVVTAEKHKRQGIGTRLVEAAEEWAREQGVTLSVCDTFLGSPQSLPFWTERMRYERRSVRLRKWL
jgi:GNAT superfamily N-acetyltransferase